MDKEYKSTAKRLVKYFESSRNKWKDRTVKYQKEKRQLGIKLRDLGNSREKWKEECKQLKTQLKKLQNKEKKTKEILRHLLRI